MMYNSNEEKAHLRVGTLPQPDPFPPPVRLYRCRAVKHFSPGAAIGWLWGMLATHEQWSDMIGTPSHDSHEAAASASQGKQEREDAAAAESFLQPIRAGIWRCLPIRTRKGCNETSLTRLIVSERCPMAHLDAAAAGSLEANAALPSGEDLTLQLDDPATGFRGLTVRATRAIQEGEAILIDLGWTPAAWTQRERGAAAPVAAPGPAAAAASSSSSASSNSYSPPADSPWIKHRKASQQKQWDNLKRFVHNNLAAYASFPYAPFTASTSADLSSARLVLGPSLLHSSLIGVRLKPTSNNEGSVSAQHARRRRRSFSTLVAKLTST